MRFLVDRSWPSGWATTDTMLLKHRGPDPGDRALLELAESENRVLITMDKDFGELIYLRRVSHAGLIRLPDVRVARRIEMIKELIDQYSDALEDRAIVTIQGGRVRVSRSPSF